MVDLKELDLSLKDWSDLATVAYHRMPPEEREKIDKLAAQMGRAYYIKTGRKLYPEDWRALLYRIGVLHAMMSENGKEKGEENEQ
jgi:predicted DNA-binding protein